MLGSDMHALTVLRLSQNFKSIQNYSASYTEHKLISNSHFYRSRRMAAESMPESTELPENVAVFQFTKVTFAVEVLADTV